MKKLLPLICLILLLVVTGCSKPTPEVEEVPLSPERAEELSALSQQLTEYMNENNIDSAMAMMDNVMKDAMDGELENVWSQLGDALGIFIETGNYVGMAGENYESIEMTLSFEKGTLIQRVVFNSDNSISGLWFRNGEI